MQKILVPTDFSTNALKALTYAAEIAEKSGAVIHLVHVIEPKINMVTMQTDSLNKITIEKKSAELNTLVASALSIYPKVKIKPHLLGDAIIPALLSYAENEEIKLIIMGTNGTGGIKETIMGTVTATAIKQTKIPILTVPIFYDLKKPEKVLLATDQFERNEDLFASLMEIAQLFSANVNIVLVKDNEEKRSEEILENEMKSFVGFMTEKFPAVSISSELLKGGKFQETISAYCESKNVDLIAMVTYPQSFWEKLLMKSDTKSMAFRSVVPILALPKMEIIN